ncbi:Prefoldin subunit 4 [Frankliniella fusca]|uniref:Prefoldin subunit 4 n=1 Tax=Frankliniella fusca TaxID=407009 RepID=A0AAE1LE53_9NEOP|nr:Prefoldin subunit 4 [Frankliniella fusca]
MAAVANSSKTSFQPESDVNITYEDQQMINKFARHNAKLDELKEEIKTKQEYLTNLKDAEDELALLEGDVEKVPFFMGESFITQNFEDAQSSLEEAKSRAEAEMVEIDQKCSEIKEIMSDLRAKLYAKFGNHINLEADDD